MSSFWSGWVIALIVITLGIALFLFFLAPRIRIPTQSDGTTGHVWAHGVLRESVRKLPVWWIVFSAALFVFGVIYLVRYPGFGSFEGTQGWTSQGELQHDIAEREGGLHLLMQRAGQLSVEQLARDADATRVGQRLFLDNCAACHGTQALGNHAIGAPSLVDADWLYGGSIEAIEKSILDGRTGAMPAWETVLGNDGVNEVAAYVLSFSNVQAPEGWAAAGKARFETICVACHGADGHGNPQLGVPNLTDQVSLYGGDFESVAASIRHGRNGVMPGWRNRLGEDQVKLITAWIWSQGADSRVAAEQ